MVFIRYPARSKGYVMYKEHTNGVDSCNVDFLNDELPTIRKIKKDVKLFE